VTDPRTATEPEDAPAVDLTAKAQVDVEQYRSSDGLDLDAAYSEVVSGPFRFRWAGRWWELPHFLELDRRALGKFNALAQMPDSDDLEAIADRVGDVLRAAFGDDEATAAAFAETPQPPLKLLMLFNQWKNHSGVDPGEAPSSNGSSGSTAEPSKRTSRATTASGSAGRSTARRKAATRRVNSSR
jgi:hypothetical protein